MLRYDLAALIGRAKRLLDEMEQQGGILGAEDGERLAELLVHLGAGRLNEGAVCLQRLEALVTANVWKRGFPASPNLPTIGEYRALLKLLRPGS